MAPSVTPEDVERLAALAGLRLPEEDLQPLVRSLVAHMELVEPLLRLDLSAVEPSLRFDPSAHG